MNDNNENKKNSFSDFLHKASDVGQKLAKEAYEGTKKTAQNIKKNSDARKKERLDPITFKMYNNKNFHVPNIIKIVDDAVRRDNKLCKGAIGYRKKENKTEILFLYDEARDICGLQFIPTFDCNAVYCVDPFDRKRYIKVDCIFSKTQEERLAELENIAYCLGAKKCSVHIITSEKENQSKNSNFSASMKKEKKSNEKGSSKNEEDKKTEVFTPDPIKHSKSSENTNTNESKVQSSFMGHDHPIRPKLKWFTYDDTVKNLIKMRCCDPKSVASRVLEISGSSSATMNRQTAVAIDCLIKKTKVKIGHTMVAQSTKELNSTLLYEIEF